MQPGSLCVHVGHWDHPFSFQIHRIQMMKQLLKYNISSWGYKDPGSVKSEKYLKKYLMWQTIHKNNTLTLTVNKIDKIIQKGCMHKN